MGETGKRSRHERDGNNEGKNQKRKHGNKEDSTDGELVVYRILCRNGVIGGVIGKGGKVINAIRQETRAKVKVVDPFPGSDKRVITIYSYIQDKDTNVDEDNTRILCPAQDALLKVHAAIVNATNNPEDSDENDKEEAYLLAPASQAANIIGRSGATIKRLKSKTRANIRFTPKDKNNASHSCAMAFDNFVQITGDAETVKRALLAVSTIMYKFSPKEEISLDTSVAEAPSTVIITSDMPIYQPGSFYPNADVILPAPGSVPPVMTTSRIPEIGYNDAGSGWPMYPSVLPSVPRYGAPSRSEELVFQVLCPSDRIGRVIGRRGSSINSIRLESGANVSVDDKKGDDECIITVTSTESIEDVKSAALEAVLLLQEKITNEDDTGNMRLLIPSKSVGCLIGKNGSVANDMRKKTKADIRISKGEKPKRAASSDELVEVIGLVGSLRDALVQIVIRLREHALRDRDDNATQNAPPVDSGYNNNLPVPPVMPGIQSLSSFSYDQRVETERGLGSFPGSSVYGYNPYQAGDSGYGSLSSYALNSYGGLPPYIEVLIPANALNKVMGSSGTNIDNIQKISGARLEIVESKTSRSERIAQIYGTNEQKRSAENLIQAFIMAT